MTLPEASAASVIRILRGDTERWRLLGMVAELDLPDGWIAAGFVRNAIWDCLHGRPPQPLSDDVDVIWFDPDWPDEAVDRHFEEQLRLRDGSVRWSVKNQARMHARNGDEPYRSASDAMLYWPETATAIAARRIGTDDCEISCPHGLEELFSLTVRPAGRFRDEKRRIFEGRIRAKGWLTRWPKLVRAEG